MSDDWRVRVDLEEEHPVADFLDRVRAVDVEADIEKKLGERVVVSHDADKVFFYTDSEAAAREVDRLVRPLLDEHGLEHATIDLLRWHPVEEEWIDASVPLPRGAEEEAAEHVTYERREAQEASERGWGDFEVRAELPSHRSTVTFARQLESEGLPVVRRWKFLIVGAATEEQAESLADRLRAEAPEGTRVIAMGSGALAWQAGDGGRLAFLGGLGN